MRCHDVNSGSFNDLILVEVSELDEIFFVFCWISLYAV